jgi:hypothetical protein
VENPSLHHHTSNTVEVVYLDSKVKRLNTAPLCDQPGARFQYGVNTDVLGAVVEAVAGMSLGKYVTLRYGMLFVKGIAFLTCGATIVAKGYYM